LVHRREAAAGRRLAALRRALAGARRRRLTLRRALLGVSSARRSLLLIGLLRVSCRAGGGLFLFATHQGGDDVALAHLIAFGNLHGGNFAAFGSRHFQRRLVRLERDQ